MSTSRLPLRAAPRRRIPRPLFAGTLAGSLRSGCASIRSVQDGERDARQTSYEVAITRVAVIPGTPEQVFSFIAAEDVLPRVLTGYGPLPAVVRTSDNTGPWTVAGSARVVHLADDSTAREQLTQYAPPAAFAYRVWDFGNPVMRSLASAARGEWHFAPAEAGTQVEWTYTFTARNAVATLPLWGIAQLLWRGYMDVCLANARRLLAPTKCGDRE